MKIGLFVYIRKKTGKSHLENFLSYLTPNTTRLEFYRRFVKRQGFFILQIDKILPNKTGNIALQKETRQKRQYKPFCF